MNAEAQKTKFRDQIGWINDNGMGGGSYSAVNVEILHKGYGGEYSLSSIFLNPILIGVHLLCAQGWFLLIIPHFSSILHSSRAQRLERAL